MFGWLRERHLDRPVREFDRWIDPEIIARRPGEPLRAHRRLVERARQRRDRAIALFGRSQMPPTE